MDSDEHSIVVDGSSPGPLLPEVCPAKTMSDKENIYYLNKFWDVRYPKSTECFKLTLKVLMNFGVCVYVCVVLDMDAISLDIN